MGLGLSIPGIVLQTNIDFVSDEIKPVLDQVSVTGIALGDVVKNLGIGFIIVGVFVFLVAVLGLMGACCKSKCLLTIVSTIFCIQRKVLNRKIKKQTNICLNTAIMGSFNLIGQNVRNNIN